MLSGRESLQIAAVNERIKKLEMIGVGVVDRGGEELGCAWGKRGHCCEKQ